jgi:hypothetical protein
VTAGRGQGRTCGEDPRPRARSGREPVSQIEAHRAARPQVAHRRDACPEGALCVGPRHLEQGCVVTGLVPAERLRRAVPAQVLVGVDEAG